MLHLIHVDRQFFRYTAYKFFRCIPSASPAHENRNKGSILLCLIILLKNVSAEQVIHIIIYLFLTLQQTGSEVSLFMTDFYIGLFLFALFQHYNVYTLSSVHRLHSSILNKIYKIIWPLMERFGVLLSSPSPASPSSTPSRSPSPSPSCVKGQASIFCIYRIPSHFITYRADT